MKTLIASLTLATAMAAVASSPAPAADPQQAFLDAIAGHCGQSFAGQIVANEPANDADPFVNKTLHMHVRECSADQIKIPFHVGEDHSRTWVLTHSAAGIQLKHDHRHADGKPDVLTQYGGRTDSAGSAQRQQFPVDAESRQLFEEQKLTASLTNTWAMEIEPGKKFVYELARPGRLFRVEFDLSKPVATPPDPWGHPPL